MSRADILIVGGEFAGMNAMIAAVRAGGDRLSVTLASRDDKLTVRPRLYEENPASLSAELRPLTGTLGVSLIEAEVTGIGIDENVVRCASGGSIAFSRLVLASGGRLTRPPIPGAELGFSVDDRASAVALETELQRRAVSGQLRSVVVLGAGFTGLEVALQLRQRLEALAGSGGISADITLLDHRADLEADVGAGALAAVKSALDLEQVELRLDARVARIEAGVLVLDGEERLSADVVIFCTGQRASPLTGDIPGDRDVRGRLVTDASLRAPGAHSVFVAGDVACAPAAPGRETLMSCQHAIGLGRVAGENAARDLLGEPLVAYRQPDYVTCLDLGRWGAVLTEGWDRKAVMAGPQAKAVKRFINERAIYPPRGPRAAILAGSLPNDGVTAAALKNWSQVGSSKPAG